MNVKAFEYLVTLAEHGNVTKAAQQLFISQSALSKFVRNLENEMETQLFCRVGKRFVLTYAGEKCIEAAKKILTINTMLNEEIGKVVNQNYGRIRLAFHSSWSDCFFMHIYPVFREHFPHVTLKLFETNSDNALHMLDNGEMDVAIISTQWHTHSKFMCKTLYAQQMVLAVHDKHPLLQKACMQNEYRYPYIDLKELKEVPIIMRHADQKTHTYAMELLLANDVTPNVVLETRMRENALQAVEYGNGAAFTLDDPAMGLKHPNIRYLSFNDPHPSNFINLVYNKGAFFSDAEDMLIKLIEENYHLLSSGCV